MDPILDMFDFNRAEDLLPAPPREDLESAVDRIERACIAGNAPLLAQEITQLRGLPESGPYLRRPGNAIALAVLHGHRAVLECLVTNSVAITPEAVKAATMAKDKWVLDLLLRSGWDINESLDYTTPSAMALTVEDAGLTAWFLNRGASPNAQCSLDLTPLSIAVQYSSIDIIMLLFKSGGSIRYGQLLHYAIRRRSNDYLEVLELVLEKGPPINNVMYQEQLESYFRQRMFGIGTPLHDAAEQGQLETVKRLISAGAHPLIKNSRGRIPLQQAEKAQHNDVVAYLSPITTKANWPPYQFTEGRETNGWS